MAPTAWFAEEIAINLPRGSCTLPPVALEAQDAFPGDVRETDR